MRLLALAIFLATLGTLTSAASHVDVGVIDRNGKISHDTDTDTKWGRDTKVPQYMTCAPKSDAKCGDKALMTGQSLQ